MGIEKPVLVFGRHDKGIAFGGLDDEPCTLILLMLTCSRDPGQHLRLLSALAQILNSDKVRAQLRKAKTPTAVIEVLTQQVEE